MKSQFQFAGLAASRLFFHVFQIPAVERIPLHRAEELFPQVGIAALQLGEQLLHLLPAAVTVHGAGVAYHGKVQLRRHAADVRFLTVQQRADLGDVRPVQIRHRLEAADPTLEQQVPVSYTHLKCCWDMITIMVTLISMATAIYFGKWIKTTLPINLLFLLLFVQLVYVGIRWYVKGWRETRGYH